MTIDGCATLLVAAGALSAVAGVRAGNRTAYALLASAIYSTLLCWAEVPFRPSLWLAIDLCVVMWIVIGWADALLHGDHGRLRDVAVLAIFALIWPLYFMPQFAWRSQAADVLVAVQMLLTFPFKTVWGKARQWRKAYRSDDGPLRLAPA
jgi:hypothetical protein